MEHKMLSVKQNAVLLVVTGLLLFSGLDKIEVNIMEARNFISAREMVQNKEYLLTTLNNEPRYQKPPLPTWLTAVSGSVFGFDSLFGLRLPVVAITFLLVFIFYCFSKQLGLGPKQTLNNSLILISSFYIFFAGRDNQWDMYTHSFMIVSILFLWKLLQEEHNVVINICMAGVFLGFSFLSKGPISLYALLIPFLISYGIVYHFSSGKKILYFMLVLVLGLCIGLSWFIYVRYKDPEYFRVIAVREASNWSSYETKPFWYYWNFFIQSGLWTIPSVTALIYPWLKKRVENLKAYRFAFFWTMISVIFLSLVPEKKARYLVPVLIPLALTTGFYIEYLMKNFNKNMEKKEKIWVGFSFGIISLIGFSYPVILLFLLKGHINGILLVYIFSSLLMCVFAFFIIKGLIDKDFVRIFYSMISIFVVLVIALIPLRNKISINPGFASAHEAQIIGDQYNVNTYRLSDIAPEIVWDFGKPIPVLKKIGNQTCIPEEKEFGLITDKSDSTLFKEQFAGFNIEKQYTIDMNYDNKNKPRLIKDYYILSKNGE